MAKRKRKGGRRRRVKIGLLQVATGAAAIAEFTQGRMLSNSITSAIRGAYTDPVPGGVVGKAILIAMVGQLIHTESNKAGMNPAYGPVRLF